METEGEDFSGFADIDRNLYSGMAFQIRNQTVLVTVPDAAVSAVQEHIGCVGN